MNNNKEITNLKNTSPVSKIMKQLMIECGIIEAELARQTGVPQTTINRLLLGETSDPRATTLIQIAKFFKVTVGQILGEEPISKERIAGTYNSYNRNAWSVIPIINWEDAASWIFSKNKYNPNTHKAWITTELKNSQNSFALETRELMEPRFKKRSIIIIDPDHAYKDGHYIIVSINNSEATVRRIMKDGSDILLKKLYGKDEPQRLTSADKIIGVITETRTKEE